MQLLLQYRNDFGQGVRQPKFRGATTKDRPGTLPLYRYNTRPEMKEVVNIDRIVFEDNVQEDDEISV